MFQRPSTLEEAFDLFATVYRLQEPYLQTPQVAIQHFFANYKKSIISKNIKNQIDQILQSNDQQQISQLGQKFYEQYKKKFNVYHQIQEEQQKQIKPVQIQQEIQNFQIQQQLNPFQYSLISQPEYINQAFLDEQVQNWNTEMNYRWYGDRSNKELPIYIIPDQVQRVFLNKAGDKPFQAHSRINNQLVNIDKGRQDINYVKKYNLLNDIDVSLVRLKIPKDEIPLIYQIVEKFLHEEVLQQNRIPMRLFFHAQVEYLQVQAQQYEMEEEFGEYNPVIISNWQFHFPNKEFQLNMPNIREWIDSNLEVIKQIEFYYGEVVFQDISFINLYFLISNETEYSPEQHLQHILSKVQAFNNQVFSSTWQKIDVTLNSNDLIRMKCLLRCLLFMLRKFNHLNFQDWTINTLMLHYHFLYTWSIKGNVLNVYEWIRKNVDNDFYLYYSDYCYWFENMVPIDNKYVLVIRKTHVQIVLSHILLKILKQKQTKVYKLKKAVVQKIKIHKFAWDIETYTRTEDNKKYQIPYLLVVTSKLYNKQIFWGKDCITQFIRFCLKLGGTKTDNYEFWSFNGSKFDNLLVILEILKYTADAEIFGSNTQIKVIKFRNLYFFDMCLIYKGSLENVAQNLDCEQQKKENFAVANLSQEEFENNKEQIVHYCIQDCEILMSIIKKHYEFKKLFNVHKFHCGTISQLSFKIFLQNYYDNSLKIQGAVTWNQYLREKASYHGGFTQSFKRGLFENIYDYDINSSYPYVMLGKMPLEFIKEDFYEKGEQIIDCNMYELEGEWQDAVLSPLYCENKTGTAKYDFVLVYPQKFSLQFRWGVEIKYMVKHNLFKWFNIHKKFVYASKEVFKQFIEALYDERIKAKQENKQSLQLSLKVCMNSLYGKMGQRKFNDTIWCSQALLDQFAARPDLKGVKCISEEHGIYKLDFEDDLLLKFQGSLVRFASYITACARMNLFKIIHKTGFENVYYCDTDSLISAKTIPQKYIDSSKLGKWKLEFMARYVEIYGPKFYRIINSEDEISGHCKGVKTSIIEDENFWTNFQQRGTIEIINKNIFHRAFGQIWITDDKKLIQNLDSGRIWTQKESRPFYSMDAYKKYVDLKYQENRQKNLYQKILL